ncbi:cyclin-D5-2-like [Triticum urartu]|uniref:cyclin-D5-2-like n=1 Tax=Triticum urartu TaxID=4572 RepID=UPI00204370FE|nr:cyclin-D5-2-like [Triticum urartu]
MLWVARLLSVACVSVAAKMEYCTPALSKFDASGSYKFCSASIRRMELPVLSTFGWHMAAVTPFHYLPCFSSRFDRHDSCGGCGHDPACVALKSIGFIFATTEADSVLDYMPSTMAAAAILPASYGALMTKEALELVVKKRKAEKDNNKPKRRLSPHVSQRFDFLLWFDSRCFYGVVTRPDRGPFWFYFCRDRFRKDSNIKQVSMVCKVDGGLVMQHAKQQQGEGVSEMSPLVVMDGCCWWW